MRRRTGRNWILSIDQGTTGTRSMVVNDEGSPVAVRYRAHRQIRPQTGWVEHDPEEIWRNVEGTVSSALSAASVTAADLAGVGIANQGETVMAWDSLTGRPVADVGPLGDDQADTGGSPARVVGPHVVTGDTARGEHARHRRHHDAVGDGETVQGHGPGQDLRCAGDVGRGDGHGMLLVET